MELAVHGKRAEGFTPALWEPDPKVRRTRSSACTENAGLCLKTTGGSFAFRGVEGHVSVLEGFNVV